jgi:hypothetical protein
MTPTIRPSVTNKEELKIISLRKFARLTPHYFLEPPDKSSVKRA